MELTRCQTKLASPALALGPGFQLQPRPLRARLQLRPRRSGCGGGRGLGRGTTLAPPRRSGLGLPRAPPTALLPLRSAARAAAPGSAYHGRAAGVAEPCGSGGRPGSVPRHLAPGRRRPLCPAAGVPAAARARAGRPAAARRPRELPGPPGKPPHPHPDPRAPGSLVHLRRRRALHAQLLRPSTFRSQILSLFKPRKPSPS